jgi:hypothetical protein
MSSWPIGHWRVLACASGALVCGVILGLALGRGSWGLGVIGVALTQRDDGEVA